MTQTSPAPGKDEILAIIGRQLHLEGPLLPILHDLQNTYAHIPETAVPLIADALNIGRAEVHGVISFYHDFSDLPAGHHRVKICRAEACQAVGGAEIGQYALEKLGLEWHGTSANGRVTIEPVYCLGLGACAPAAMVDDTVVGRLDTDKIDSILAEVGA